MEQKALKLQQMDEWRNITVGATGHRPNKMGGYMDALGGYNRNHPIVVQLRTQSLISLEGLIVEHGVSRFISGGALGFDSLFFWCVNHLKKKYPHIKNIVAIPFKNQWIKWMDTLPEAVKWYHEMLRVADEVIDVAREEGYLTYEDQGERPIHLDNYSNDKLKKRNEYIADHISYLFTFYDGSNSGTGHCINYIKKKNRVTILRMDPRHSCKPMIET
ncbi:SLOG family protein (plasmid) [Paenibacillus thiaminolyticus]|uniref:SLOG family protein n=1 Tax=Paenibacillus thiaminolyticus TaxID=49283 RepID=UPI00232FFBE1|nr:SLOG family protein [Paenibacillus thiaminolyticus]WCF11618.1 SLOG family protein [Paenibacillus thiaminolyticus]